MTPQCANQHSAIPMEWSYNAGAPYHGLVYICPQCNRKVEEYRHPMIGELLIDELYPDKGKSIFEIAQQ